MIDAFAIDDRRQANVDRTCAFAGVGDDQLFTLTASKLWVGLAGLVFADDSKKAGRIDKDLALQDVTHRLDGGSILLASLLHAAGECSLVIEGAVDDGIALLSLLLQDVEAGVSAFGCSCTSGSKFRCGSVGSGQTNDSVTSFNQLCNDTAANKACVQEQSALRSVRNNKAQSNL